ncbi:MAG: type II secretion system protein [Actinomycetota bacterium]|jgi:type IV pilus assembly protein PilA|nr:type II secretion system protein [Actinomycetota bacterium]
MLNQLRERRDDDQGFTLIELMVVVLIIAILVAIAVPTFLGARTRAQDRSAQSTARNALTTGRILFTDDGDFGDPTRATVVTNMEAVDGAFDFVAGASTASAQISVMAFDGADADALADRVVYAVLSDSGDCFYIQDDSGNGGTGATSYSSATAASCDANSTAGLTWSTGSGW